jgi:flagellar basal body P-ring formation protein FlgA
VPESLKKPAGWHGPCYTTVMTKAQQSCLLVTSRTPAVLQGPWLPFATAAFVLGFFSIGALANQTQGGAAEIGNPELGWLESEAKSWVARNYGLPADSVVFAPLDKRLSITPCPEPVSIDAPFGGVKTLRVRCAPDNWQVFLQRADQGGARQQTGAAQSTTYGKSILRSESHASSSQQLPRSRATSLTEAQASVVVAKQNLMAGQALDPGAFAVETRIISGNPSNYFLQPDGLEFSELLRDIKAGEPIRQRDLRKALLIRRNHLVQFTLSNAPGLQVSLQLQAMDDGRIGDQVRLKNPDSGRILTGLVVGRNLVRGL